MSRVIYYFIKKIIFILWVHVTTTPITDIHTDTPITTKINTELIEKTIIEHKEKRTTVDLIKTPRN